jgi:hypothetical protein
MKTKTLLLTMALGAASVASSMAQVYSANAVGYVNLTLQPGFNLIANPLNGTNNHLNTILPLPNSAGDTIIFRFKPGTQNYGDAITFLADFGWFTTDAGGDAWMTIPPGEGFFIQPAGPTPLSVTFVGEVPQGNLSNPVVGNNNYSILASQVPQALPLGSAGEAGTLMFPAIGDDLVYIFDPVAQGYKQAYTFLDGFGWFSTNTDDPGPEGPTIPVATSFFVQKKGALSQAWTRTFTVN